jgi:NAD(P)-dependent dehydrogenase (short-subunit alcohol dehydrogenase family)
MSNPGMGGPLAGRHALVTGASRGIGAAIARRLAAEGATLTLLGRDEAALHATRDSIGPGTPVTCVVADVGRVESLSAGLAAARAHFGPVELLVNNAGQAASAPLHKTDAATFDRMIAVNLAGTYHAMRETLPDMLRAGWGRIINVASIAGLKGYPYVAAYCAAKHGVVGLTRAAALEVAARGVTVNAVCPGYTDTGIVSDAVANIRDKTGRSAEEAVASLVAFNPQGRLVQPEEVAHTVAWLCLPGSEAVNGQAIAVAGGEA